MQIYKEIFFILLQTCHCCWYNYIHPSADNYNTYAPHLSSKSQPSIKYIQVCLILFYAINYRLFTTKKRAIVYENNILFLTIQIFISSFIFTGQLCFQAS